MGLVITTTFIGAFLGGSFVYFQEKKDSNVEKQNIQLPFGIPTLGQFQAQSSYSSYFDYRLKIPTFVIEHLTTNNLNEEVKRKEAKFKEDKTIPTQYRPTLKDYKSMNQNRLIKLSRGHMAAAGNHKYDKTAMDSTFLLGSNILPQDSSQNSGHWNILERTTRNLLKDKRVEEVYVMTGPLFLPTYNEEDNRKYVSYEVIGENNIAVPTHLFKVIAVRDKERRIIVGSFVLPNKPIDKSKFLSDFLVPLAFVESVAGIRIIPALMDYSNQKIEKINESLCELTDCKKTIYSVKDVGKKEIEDQ